MIKASRNENFFLSIISQRKTFPLSRSTAKLLSSHSRLMSILCGAKSYLKTIKMRTQMKSGNKWKEHKIAIISFSHAHEFLNERWLYVVLAAIQEKALEKIQTKRNGHRVLQKNKSCERKRKESAPMIRVTSKLNKVFVFNSIRTTFTLNTFSW